MVVVYLADGPLADGHAVRFRSVVEEISPPLLIAPEPTSVEPGLGIAGEVTREQLRNLSHSLHNNFLQERRMLNFAYEPFSLPASRVCFGLAPPQCGCLASALAPLSSTPLLTARR